MSVQSPYRHECVGHTFRGFWCAYVSVGVCCVYHKVTWAGCFVHAAGIVESGASWQDVCCVPVSWVQSLFTRMLGPLCSTVWAADTGRLPNCPPTTGFSNSDTVSYLTLPRISLQRLLVLQVECRKLLSNGRLFSALTGGAGVHEALESEFGKCSPSTHSGCFADTRGMF